MADPVAFPVPLQRLTAFARRRSAWLCAIGVVLALAIACTAITSHDEAEREFIACLRGAEDGSTDAQRLAHVDRAIALAPGRARYLEVRAMLFFDRGDLTRARSDLDRAIVLADRPYLRYLRALTWSRMGQWALALGDFDRAITAQPGNTQFYRGRALARVALGRASEALADGNRMVTDTPQRGESYYTRGVALAALGRDVEANTDFTEALRRRPDLAYPRLARAQSRARLGDSIGASADRAEAARMAMLGNPTILDPLRY